MAAGDSQLLIVKLARLLNVDDLDPTTIQLCVRLLDEGIDPKVLAKQIQEISKEKVN